VKSQDTNQENPSLEPETETTESIRDTEASQDQEVKVSEFARGRGKETLFRVTFRNQINLIAIADNKANMIISLNAVLISLIIAVFGSGITIQGQPFMEKIILVIPFTILMFYCLISGVFAILTAKPHIIRSPEGINNPKLSLLFFGNFYNKKLDQYLDDMSELLNSRKTIYEHLTIDIYNQGKVLQRKYKLLNISYWNLMAGIISTVLAYLILWIAK